MADINWVLIITKLPLVGWAINKVADERVKSVLEGASKMQEVAVKALTEEAVKHAQEAQFYKTEIDRVVGEERKKLRDVMKIMVEYTVEYTYKHIEEKFYLTPKNIGPYLREALAAGSGLLPPPQK